MSANGADDKDASAETVAFLIGLFQTAADERDPGATKEGPGLVLTADTPIAETGVDSFDFVELIFKVEDRFGIAIDYNANETVAQSRTIGDLAGEIDRRVAKKQVA